MFRKSYFYYVFIIVLTIAIISISSCEKDEVFEETSLTEVNPPNSIDPKKIKRQTLNWNEFSEINQMKGTSSIFESFGVGNNGFQIQNDSTSTHLIVDHIEMYTYQGVTTFTFVIIEDNTDTSFRNLIIRTEDDITFNAYVAKYDPSQAWLDSNHSITPFEGEVELTPFTGTYQNSVNSVPDCAFSINVVWECDAGYNHPPGHSRCNVGGAEIVVFDITVTCSGGPTGGSISGDSDYNPGDNPDNPSNGEATGATTSGNDTTNPGSELPINGIITKPLISVGPLVQIFFDQLPANLRDYINHYEQYDLSITIGNFLRLQGLSDENKQLVQDFLEISINNRDVKFERYEELVELLDNDPFALIRDCLTQSGLDSSEFVNLFNHTIPQSCEDRLEDLSWGINNFINQPISEGNVPCANIDYYGIEITTMPDLDNDGIPENESDLFIAYKNKFLDVASGELDDFQFESNIPANPSNTADIWWNFSPYLPLDMQTFDGFNPISAIFTISAGTDGLLTNLTADEGAVIVSDYVGNSHWTVSTIETPFGVTGSQPFSGNRQWGITRNAQGNTELFTRAVDVAKMTTLIENDPFNQLTEKQNDYYNIANATWENLQSEVINWINSKNGVASISLDTTVLKVDKEKILELLKQSETIDEINCN
ncbi:hypothetical protein DDD_1717 [Nonlabens dokdonensis DSW-6]|jgi:hypothetical protein|uniref:Uncharacterized protein n=2 Tax=Nonlabens dokdonensis TaxID=328515 RepID=L7W9R1_NONDD|nr:hypothetical protein DDD_1717 [Nonlabens dokdonensis DSW-6]